MNAAERSRLIARVFSRPVFESIARRGCATDIARKLRSLGVCAPDPHGTVGELFDAGLELVANSYRCEYVYKAAIASRIIFGRHSPRTCSLALELPVAGSIVDAAVFNGTSTAYEIKTEFDSHRRLCTQTPAYLRAFERVYVVTHPDFAQRYLSEVDERVGVLALTQRNTLTRVREAVRDASRVEPAVVFRMLRRQEYIDAVCARFGVQPQLPNGRISAHYEGLFRRFTPVETHAALVRAMRARNTDESMASYLRALPESLRAVAYATPLSLTQRKRVLNALAQPV